MLLTYFKGQEWGHTRHMLTTSCDLLPSREPSRAVLQTEIYIYFFCEDRVYSKQPGWFIFITSFYDFFSSSLFQKRAIPSWYLCPQLLGAYGTCKQFSLCVKWNKTRSVMAGRTHVQAVSFLSAAIFDVLLRGCQTKTRLCNRFHLKDSKTFHLLGNTGMIPPASCKLNKNKWRLNRSWSRS